MSPWCDECRRALLTAIQSGPEGARVEALVAELSALLVVPAVVPAPATTNEPEAIGRPESWPLTSRFWTRPSGRVKAGFSRNEFDTGDPC